VPLPGAGCGFFEGTVSRDEKPRENGVPEREEISPLRATLSGSTLESRTP
jgi:hypothetical protein